MSQPPYDPHAGRPVDPEATLRRPGQQPVDPQQQYQGNALSRPAQPYAQVHQAAHAAYGPGPAQAQPAPAQGGAAVPAQGAAPTTWASGQTAAAPTVQGAGQAGETADATAQARAQQWGSSAVLTRPSAGATAAPSPPPAPPGTVYRPGERAPEASSQRLTGLHIGSHVVNASALEQLSGPALGPGLLVGADRDRTPVVVRLFRRKPTNIVLVGGVWAARLITFRALAMGAQVYAITGQPSAWDGLGAHAVGQRERVQMAPAEFDLPPGSAYRPMLVVRDTAPGGAVAALSSWQTRVTVVHHLDHNAMSALGSADLVLFQRLQPGEAQIAAHVLGLNAATARLMQQLEPEMLAVLGEGSHRYVWLHRTAIENYLLGAPQR
ncbi:hypothetical protein [Dactylosporangium sp. CA-139066]|uniref:hypothetical protein n=1 Tax=Dactylosporangium sp. CA-139066 TaxID=3239930 RepID=UPI003D8E830C